MIKQIALFFCPQLAKTYHNRQILTFVCCFWDSNSIQPCFVNTWTNTTCSLEMLLHMGSTNKLFTFQFNSLLIFSTFSFEITLRHVVGPFDCVTWISCPQTIFTTSGSILLPPPSSGDPAFSDWCSRVRSETWFLWITWISKLIWTFCPGTLVLPWTG